MAYRTENDIKNDIEKARAQLGILNNYIETYEMISDEGLFKKPSMANTNARNVIKVIDLKEKQIQDLRRELHDYKSRR